MVTAAFNRASEISPVSTDDARIKKIVTAMKRFKYRSDALIEILHLVQESFGYLPISVIAFVSRELKVPASRAFGVITFYHFFSLKPKGEHTCLVCTGTACHVRGAGKVLDDVVKTFRVQPGQTTVDGKLSLETARCLGCCGLAPVFVVDEQVFGNVTTEKITEVLREKVGA